MTIKIGDTIVVKQIDAIKAIHNVVFDDQLVNIGPGWFNSMDHLSGNTYDIVSEDLNSKDGDWFCIRDHHGSQWWLLDKWFDVEEVTSRYPVSKQKTKCRYHDQPTNITIENVMLLDNEPVDMWSKNAEDRLITDALSKAGGMLKYRLRSWPICGSGGRVDLWGYLDREAKTVTAHWCCSCSYESI